VALTWATFSRCLCVSVVKIVLGVLGGNVQKPNGELTPPRHD